MPYSSSSGKSKMGKFINNLITDDRFAILDLGCGSGTYSKLITKPCIKVGVDALDYREKFDLDSKYNKFFVSDIRDTEFLESLGKFNLCILGDVLEHVFPEEARKVLDSLEKTCDSILIAVPYQYEQHFKNNHWEDHLQADLTPEIFSQRYPEFTLISLHTRKAPPWNGGAYYGYYFWERVPNVFK